jgi:dUTP pyrophosphatase
MAHDFELTEPVFSNETVAYSRDVESTLRVQILDNELPLPTQATFADAGLDLMASSSVSLTPRGGRAIVGTGLALEIPEDVVGLVMPRSGLAARHGVTVLNAPGVIDPGYRGELKVILVNLDPELTYQVERGDRVAQLLLLPSYHATLEVVAELSESERGDSGFGHSGR